MRNSEQDRGQRGLGWEAGSPGRLGATPYSGPYGGQATSQPGLEGRCENVLEMQSRGPENIGEISHSPWWGGGGVDDKSIKIFFMMMAS